MKNNIVSMREFADRKAAENQELEDEDLRHHDDGERCICWNCEHARRNPVEPDWKSLPLFRDYVK